MVLAGPGTTGLVCAAVHTVVLPSPAPCAVGEALAQEAFLITSLDDYSSYSRVFSLQLCDNFSWQSLH